MKTPKKQKLKISGASLGVIYFIGLFLFGCSMKQFDAWKISDDGMYVAYLAFMLVWTGICCIPYADPVEEKD